MKNITPQYSLEAGFIAWVVVGAIGHPSQLALPTHVSYKLPMTYAFVNLIHHLTDLSTDITFTTVVISFLSSSLI